MEFRSNIKEIKSREGSWNSEIFDKLPKKYKQEFYSAMAQPWNELKISIRNLSNKYFGCDAKVSKIYNTAKRLLKLYESNDLQAKQCEHELDSYVANKINHTIQQLKANREGDLFNIVRKLKLNVSENWEDYINPKVMKVYWENIFKEEEYLDSYYDFQSMRISTDMFPQEELLDNRILLQDRITSHIHFIKI